ncbi:MAG: chloramphenicol phosphotransferase [Dehalococcoidia bacterium]
MPDDSSPTIYHLIGTPGVGKYTIGTELARLTGAKLVDNHAVANVIFNVLDQDGIKPLPDGVWTYVREVRRAVLDTMIHVSPNYLSFVFTNYIRGEDEREYAYFLENVAVAEIRGSRFVPVLLTCETAELMNRIGTESRRRRMKLLDPIEARRLNNEVPQFATDHPNFFTVDTTHRPPAESAQLILEKTESLHRTENKRRD